MRLFYIPLSKKPLHRTGKIPRQLPIKRTRQRYHRLKKTQPLVYTQNGAFDGACEAPKRLRRMGEQLLSRRALRSAFNYDLIHFYRVLKPEIVRVIRQESLEIGPLKFNFAIRAVLKKETQAGEETIDFFLRQENPTLLNVFSREEVERMLDEERNKKKE